ncbi:helix-turn-helix domain-containing protein (plasmid) [Streptomyces viridifaciens]|uniref:transcriptional regulator n=1 Tax=Kitasatospora aureofaciens TaxID=1894 RepID=UPI00092BD767|nr:transcriptional regulator [Streptomyces viridifaciens]UKZ03835.1 helix-turn-helix domain-containing protein [Streptomyces viridifaciens]
MSEEMPTSEVTAPATSIDALRVMAHPARIRLYEFLVHHGASTVSELARRSDLAIGSVSYHLSQLHKAGLVMEAAEEGTDRRQHWWKAVPGGLQWSPADFVDSPSHRRVSSLAQQMFSERRMERLTQWLHTWDQWPKEWLNAVVETDMSLELTPDELEEMAAELQSVVRRWSRRTPTGADSSRRRVFTMIHAFPMADDAADHE